jgi:hypothetical protein
MKGRIRKAQGTGLRAQRKKRRAQGTGHSDRSCKSCKTMYHVL